MPHLDIHLSPQNDARRNIILSLPGQIEGDVMPRDVADAIRGLWKDPGVKEAVSRSREFQLNDSAVYYFNSIDRMAAPNYLPTDQDILRSRVKTTGITETTFKVGELTYKLFDVGGQRSERKKWIHCFENVTALVFLVSLSEYDQMLYEDESVVRLHSVTCQSLRLHTSIIRHRTVCKRPSPYSTRYATQDGLSRRQSYVSAHVTARALRPHLRRPAYHCMTNLPPILQILFLNKIDLFAEKLPRSPLGDYFPDYAGGDDYDAACNYLLHRFVSLNQSAATKQIYAHYTCATDTQQIKCTYCQTVSQSSD